MDSFTRFILDSPLVREIVDQARREVCVRFLLEILDERFGVVTPTITAGLGRFEELDPLHRLVRRSAVCESLQAFETTLREELRSSTPSKRRAKHTARRPTMGRRASR